MTNYFKQFKEHQAELDLGNDSNIESIYNEINAKINKYDMKQLRTIATIIESGGAKKKDDIKHLILLRINLLQSSTDKQDDIQREFAAYTMQLKASQRHKTKAKEPLDESVKVKKSKTGKSVKEDVEKIIIEHHETKDEKKDESEDEAMNQMAQSFESELAITPKPKSVPRSKITKTERKQKKIISKRIKKFLADTDDARKYRLGDESESEESSNEDMETGPVCSSKPMELSKHNIDELFGDDDYLPKHKKSKKIKDVVASGSEAEESENESEEELNTDDESEEKSDEKDDSDMEETEELPLKRDLSTAQMAKLYGAPKEESTVTTAMRRIYQQTAGNKVDRGIHLNMKEVMKPTLTSDFHTLPKNIPRSTSTFDLFDAKNKSAARSMFQSTLPKTNFLSNNLRQGLSQLNNPNVPTLTREIQKKQAELFKNLGF